MNIYEPICAPELPNVFGGYHGFFPSRYGKMFYNMAGKGYPLLLVHGINAGASNFEWENNFLELSKYFTVYAPDLPGFGKSEKLPIQYTASVYTYVIQEFIRHVIQQPVFIVASGLSAAYCCNVAYTNPQSVISLALVTPSGICTNSEVPCETSFTVFRLFTGPVQGNALYNAFVSKTSIRYFLTEFIYAHPEDVTDQVVDYLYRSSHQCPNSSYAPASFVSGLSNLNIASLFGELKQKILLLWGKKAKIGSLPYINDFLGINPSAQFVLFPESAMNPQAESSSSFNKIIVDYFST
ncbi:MAG TPA: alpha/beta fold hydrolase [Desulfosporosinus sp.]|nr:alpha/beta fold hydrolase [Desulfosporosinus sp.]